MAPKAFQTLQGWAEWSLARQGKIVPILFALWLHCTTLEFASSESKQVKRETDLKKKKKAKQREWEKLN